MATPLSYLSLERNVKILKALGICPIDPKSTKIKRIVHGMYRVGIFSMIVLYTLQEILKVYEQRDDADKVMATMFLFLTYTDFIYKIGVIWMKSDQIEEIFRISKGPIYNQGEEEHREPLLKTARQAVIVIRIFNYMALSTCVLWSIQPTIQHIQIKSIELQIWLPFDANRNPHFYIAIFYMWIQTSWLALGNTTIDGLIAFLLEQCKAQITILRLDLENIVEKSELQKKELSDSFSDILEYRLKQAIIHHREILKMANKVQDIFGNAVFYLFIIGGWILCTTVYRMVTVNTVSVEFASMVLYMNCILMELFLLCYYGNRVTVESNMLTESAYASDWLAFPVKHRRMLIMFMERVKYPIQPMAGHLVPLSNSSFVSILRSSYTFYAFLKNSDRGADL